MRSRRTVSVDVLSIMSVAVSQIYRALNQQFAYRKQLSTADMPTHHNFPCCRYSSDLCRSLLIAESAGVCLV